MADDFISWDDLDLDYMLGENNWTDAEQDDILGSEQEWLSSENESFPLPSTSTSSTSTPAESNKENRKPKQIRKQYKCPLCEKQYSSTSGFRGHVLKKHNRPDIKAHKHQMRAEAAEVDDVHLPPKKVPLSNKDEFEQELPGITKSALQALQHDEHLTSATSNAGRFIIQIAIFLQLQLPMFCSFLFVFLSSVFVDNIEPDKLLQNVHQLRLNLTFIGRFSDLILGNMTLEIQPKVIKRFMQHFLTKFTASFFSRKAELMETQRKFDIEVVTDNDSQVIFYICGYVIHALRKRYYRIKNHSKRDRLLSSLDNLQSTDEGDLPASEWTKIMNRGGLKKPSDKFHKLMMQVERWLRESVHKDSLHQDSLVLLQNKLMDYQLLNTCWDRLVTNCDDKLLLLDHVLALFLKVRGFALVKLVRKDICKKRKDSKITAGTKKALRKELKELNETN